MKEQHYLGFKHLVGESIRYVAMHDEKWVGLLGFCSGTSTSASRDQWIGWSIPQRLQRLKYIVNNSRFLIPLGVQTPNLASKTLALVLQRISQDWQEKYRHPVLLANGWQLPASIVDFHHRVNRHTWRTKKDATSIYFRCLPRIYCRYSPCGVVITR